MADFYAIYPPQGGGGGVSTYPTLGDFPGVAADGALAIALDTHILYEYDSSLPGWVAIASPGAALSIGTFDDGAPSVEGLKIESNDLIAQSASASVPGMVNTGTQEFGGDKTFNDSVLIVTNLDVTGQVAITGNLSANNFSGSSSGTNTGNVTIGTANGLALVGQALSMDLSSGSTTGSLSSTDWNTFNNKQPTLTIGNLTDVGTDGIVITGGTGAVIGAGTSLSQHVADSTHNGYLSAADWIDFDAKQDSGNYLTGLTGNVTASGPGNAASTIASDVITNSMVNSSAGIAYTKLASLASANILIGSSGNVPTANAVTGDISLSNAGVTAYAGTVPLSLGGTGQTTKTPAFDALSPLTTKGDLITYAGGDNVRQGVGSNGQVLTADSAQTNGIIWTTAPGGQSINTVTNADYTITDSDGYTTVIFSTGNTNRTLTLPLAANNNTRIIRAIKSDSGTGRMIVDGASAETVSGLASISLFRQYESITIQCNGTAWFIQGTEWASFTFTPTLTNGANVAGSTPDIALVTRTGPLTILMAGTLDIDPTLAVNTATLLGISLPMTINNFSNTNQASGVSSGTSSAAAYQSGKITAENADVRVNLTFNSLDVANRSHCYNFTYMIQQ